MMSCKVALGQVGRNGRAAASPDRAGTGLLIISTINRCIDTGARSYARPCAETNRLILGCNLADAVLERCAKIITVGVRGAGKDQAQGRRQTDVDTALASDRQDIGKRGEDIRTTSRTDRGAAQAEDTGAQHHGKPVQGIRGRQILWQGGDAGFSARAGGDNPVRSITFPYRIHRHSPRPSAEGESGARLTPRRLVVL